MRLFTKTKQKFDAKEEAKIGWQKYSATFAQICHKISLLSRLFCEYIVSFFISKENCIFVNKGNSAMDCKFVIRVHLKFEFPFVHSNVGTALVIDHF